MKLDDVKKLQQKKYRARLGYYLVEGEHLILELSKALSAVPQATKIDLYITPQYLDFVATLAPVFNVIPIDAKQMKQISDTKSPQGIVACMPLPSTDEVAAASSAVQSQNEKSIYLYEVQDPGNLGTIIRTLAWFGNFRLLLSPNSVDPFNPKVVRASMGGLFHLPLELDVSISDLSSRFSQFAYLDLAGQPLNSSTFSQFDCYLFGNEARGVPQQMLAEFNAQAFTIPGAGAVESLNLANAVSISAYALYKCEWNLIQHKLFFHHFQNQSVSFHLLPELITRPY